jgi:hypothetical protein
MRQENRMKGLSPSIKIEGHGRSHYRPTVNHNGYYTFLHPPHDNAPTDPLCR